MSCRKILNQLVKEFDAWSCDLHGACKDHELKKRDRARYDLDEFLRRYPYREQPLSIARLSAKRLYDPGSGNQTFFRYIVHTLRPLGGIGQRNARAQNEAVANIKRFRRLLAVAVDRKNTLASKVDAGWDAIPGFGGDRVIVRKIVATYFPERTVPVFNHRHMEHFVECLERSRDRDRVATVKYGGDYNTISKGQQWELLTDLLIDSKAHHPTLRGEDNVYFMYCLYAARTSRPPEMADWRGHTNSKYRARQRAPKAKRARKETGSDPVADVAEVHTGIKSGRRFCDSAEARSVIEGHAMSRAAEHLKERGWRVRDVSREKRGYDLHCNRNGEVLMVEVKGKADSGDVVLLTPNEVENARRRRPKVGLIVVSRIKLSQNDGPITAAGGEIRELDPWDVDRGTLTPLNYEYRLPR